MDSSGISSPESTEEGGDYSAQHERKRRRSSKSRHSCSSTKKRATTAGVSHSSSSIIMDWLDKNYCNLAGSCLARSLLYSHYQDYCRTSSVKPQTAASFGKVIRMKFPNLTTRRLGTRGQSKYHYFGLGIKESSVYFKNDIEKKEGITRFTSNSSMIGSLSSKPTAASLPEFPHFKDTSVVTGQVPMMKLETFLLMYRSHCQRLYDSISKAHFNEVEEFLLHFWKGMPSHMLPILGNQTVLDAIMLYDSILYNSLCRVLIPDNLTVSHGSHSDETLAFSKQLVKWFTQSLTHLPESVSNVKVQAAEMFGKSLRRQLNLLEMSKRIQYILSVTGLTNAALNDLQKIDQSCLYDHIGKVTLKSQCLNGQDIVTEIVENLEQLLVKQSKVKDYLLLVDGLLYSHVIKKCSSNSLCKIDLCHDFLLLWNCFVSHWEVEMITAKAKSQGTFETLFQFLSEYITYITEQLQSDLAEQRYMKTLTAESSSTSESQVIVEDSIRPHVPVLPSSGSQQRLYCNPMTNDEDCTETIISEQIAAARPTSIPMLPIVTDTGVTAGSCQSSSLGSPLSVSTSNSPFLSDYLTADLYPLSLQTDSGVEVIDEDSSIGLNMYPFDSIHSFPSTSVGRNTPDLLEILESTDRLLTGHLSSVGSSSNTNGLEDPSIWWQD